MPDFSYQTLDVRDQRFISGGPSATGDAVGAGVQLLQKAAIALNGWAVSWRVNRELTARSAEIRASIPPGGGVLVRVGIQEWAQADSTGARAQTFLSLVIAGSGRDPTAVLWKYVNQPHLQQGAPPGWVRRDVYIWVTR